MGIPSYFSYIIKNYANIIQNPTHVMTKVQFTSLYMDCNSIIYDVVHAIEANVELKSTQCSLADMEFRIIQDVIMHISNYVSLISPSGTIFISFDGVAPMAKMEQQRTRRNKAAFMESVDFGDTIPRTSNEDKFSTTSITPGTEFMKKLSIEVNNFFSYKPHYIVSASDIAGEGENKMFQHLRENCNKNDTVAVYGLDADLIMLSLFHCDLCSNIYIYREAPAFIGNIITIDPTCKIYLLNIAELSIAIVNEMKGENSYEDCLSHDYMFMCFMLGNDFLPHFPALNIRTRGMQVLMQVYKKVIGNYKNRRFIQNKKIIWKYVALFIEELAKVERGLIIQECVERDNKYRNFRVLESTVKERRESIENAPVIYRGEEAFIAPKEFWWENRYYETLFKLKRVEPVVKDICINYLEGLEWTFTYYISNCKSWKWKYNYSYPPLLCDLTRYVPRLDTIFIEPNDSEPVSPEVQLAYVIPKSMQHILPHKMREYINKECQDKLYSEKYEFRWSFCRYLWESHLILPDVDEQIFIDLSHI